MKQWRVFFFFFYKEKRNIRELVEGWNNRDKMIVLYWKEYLVRELYDFIRLLISFRHNSLNFIVSWVDLFLFYQFDYLKNLSNIYLSLFAIRI